MTSIRNRGEKKDISTSNSRSNSDEEVFEDEPAPQIDEDDLRDVNSDVDLASQHTNDQWKSFTILDDTSAMGENDSDIMARGSKVTVHEQQYHGSFVSSEMLKKKIFIVISVVLVMIILTMHISKIESVNMSLRKSGAYITPDQCFADIHGSTHNSQNKGIPFFWHIPHSSFIFEACATSCLELTLASYHSGDLELKSKLKIHTINGKSFVNVDLFSTEGIDHAAKLHLAKSDLADVMVSPFVNYGPKMLLDKNMGRLFTIMRDPIPRAISVFDSFVSSATIPEISDMKISEYLESQYMESNWMIRAITDKRQLETIGEEDLEYAKSILSEKCLIGLYERIEDSFDRFETYFGWEGISGKTICQKQIYQKAQEREIETNERSGKAIYDDDKIIEAMRRANSWDILLYEHAVSLFAEQEFSSKENIAIR